MRPAEIMKRSTLIALALLALAVAVAFIPTGDGDSRVTPIVANDSLLIVKVPPGDGGQLIGYEGFNVYFRPDMHQPGYVAWTLSPDEADADVANRRDATFRPDTGVEGCATLDDYRNSGFDRGHMAPAADMKWSHKAMADCHLLTNICPQDKSVNGGPWATIEKNSRKWCQRFGELYIVAGPVLGDRLTRSIGPSKVPVPERFFKVIVAPDARPPMGIAFLMPNHPFDGGAQSTVVSIDEIEAITGYDFFSALPDDVENEVESQHSMAAWNH